MLDILVSQQGFWRGLLDVLLALMVLLAIFRTLRGTKGIYFINGLLVLFFFFVISRYFQLILFSQLLDQITTALIVALPIIFQSELKRGMEQLGEKNPFIKWLRAQKNLKVENIDVVVEAVFAMAQKKIGALIVFERETPLLTVMQSGSKIDAGITPIMLEQLFFKGSPLHDGAALVVENRIIAAGCFLPLDNSIVLDQSFGSRHRAALSLALQTDAVVVVISEETGNVAVAYNGKLETKYSAEQLSSKLKTLLQSKSTEKNDKKQKV